jgi:hypothetical protein
MGGQCETVFQGGPFLSEAGIERGVGHWLRFRLFRIVLTMQALLVIVDKVALAAVIFGKAGSAIQD